MPQRWFHILSLLVGVLGCAAAADAQTETKKAFDFLEGKFKAVEASREAQLKILAAEWRKQEAEWQKLKRNMEAIAQAGENKYIEATTNLEQSVKEHAPTADPLQRQLHVENLYQLAGLYAEMGEYEKAEERVLRGWRFQQRMDGPANTVLVSRIRGSLTVAAVLHRCDKLLAAADHAGKSLEWCGQLPKNLYQADQNSLLAACLLERAEIANSTGNHYQAHEIAGQAIKMLKATGSKLHLDVAAALHCQAVAAIQLDRTLEALDQVREAEAILNDYYPQGHPRRAAIRRTMAQIHFVRGKKKDALSAVEQARLEYESLFPDTKYPRGHPGLIQAWTALGYLQEQFGSVAEALKLHSRAWNICQKFYPQAHVNKLACLLSYARCLRSAGNLPEALPLFHQAETMAGNLDGQTDQAKVANVALCLVQCGITEVQLERPEAKQTLQRALAMYEKLAPDGHPQISIALQALGAIHFQKGEMAEARAAFRRALSVDQQALERFAGIAAEAEALSFRARRNRSYHAFLSAGRDLNDGAADYGPVWTAKGTVTRLLQKRRVATRLMLDKSAEVRQLLERSIDVRTQLGFLIRGSREDSSARAKSLHLLVEEKEDLERKLAKQAPELGSLAKSYAFEPAELARRLPSRSVFVDLVFYEAPGGESHYCAFVLAPGTGPWRVDLGSALPINRAIKEWREAAKRWQRQLRPDQQEEWQRVGDEQAIQLRRFVWEPIARCFPPGTKLVYVAPDGDLSCFPFAALPGDKTGTIVLEEFVIAHVPHGPFLLDQLMHPATLVDERGRFLAVGGVDYGADSLSGTAAEIKTAQRSAGERTVTVLEGDRATHAALCDALPLARDAHLATHGYFASQRLADEHEKLARFLKTWRAQGDDAAPSLGLGNRSPLSYTGLVLAGNPRREPSGENGVLSGETVADLPLENLRLVVLSACETGLGESTAGEGVQGLQRAFHLAGCANVVATLWRVDDAATQILMTEFYRQLWERNKSPLEALYLAQRKVCRDPQLASAPGLTHPRFWAGFVFSGSGLPFSVNPDDPLFGHVEDDAPALAAPSSSVAGWVVAGLLSLGAFAVAAAYWRRRTRPVFAEIVPASPQE